MHQFLQEKLPTIQKKSIMIEYETKIQTTSTFITWDESMDYSSCQNALKLQIKQNCKIAQQEKCETFYNSSCLQQIALTT